MIYDTLIVGGGPAGLAAALTLGRARKRVLLCDAGTPRNAAATHIYNFVTRDGTPPAEFRQIGRAQLAPYSSVEVRDIGVESISGSRGAFEVQTTTGAVQARRIILCTGMIDDLLTIPGFREAWGHSIFQCPYCHGWEVKERPWGYLALQAEVIESNFPALLRSWTEDVIVFTNAAFDISDGLAEQLERAGVQIEQRAIAALIADGGKLEHVEFTDGARIACEVLYAHPPQRHVDMVKKLDLALDELGYVKVDPMTRQSSIAGIYAAGDLTTRAQGAILAAATGVHAASMLNHELTVECVMGDA